MREKILLLMNHHGCSKRTLQEKLGLSQNEIEFWLQQLLEEKLIYKDAYNKFCRVEPSHVIGKIETNSKGQKFVRNKKEKIFILSEKLHTALKNDLVVLEIYGQFFGEVLGIIERKNKKLICEVVKNNKKLSLVPFNIGCEISIVVTDKNLLKNFVDGDRVIITLDDSIDKNNTIYVKNAERIGHKNDPKSDEFAIAISKDFDIDFSVEAFKETEAIPTEVSAKDKIDRVDLTEEVTFTIDSEHTKDMDDAISIKKLYNGNFLLGVHIADVSYYVKPGMAIFSDAEKRGTSLYLGDTVIPMIPHKLSNGICSLNEGEERLTKTCLMEITPKGKVQNYKIFDSVIKSRKKMTYEELNKLFQGEEVDESYYPFLYELSLARELSDILTHAKDIRGNIDFESNEIKVKNNEDEQPLEFTSRNNEEAERIIENFMIIANETVATYFYWQDLPFIYRVHNLPDEIRLEQTMELIQSVGSKMIKLQNSYGHAAIQSVLNKYKGTLEYSIISNLLLRNMSKAKYSTTNIGHYALALDNYCHFTSPIRRFPDLMVHHLLNIFNKDYSMNNLDKIKERLDEISEHSSYKERQANDAERDYLNLKMAKFMASHIGEEFEGMIIDIDSVSVSVKLDNNIKGIIALTEEFAEAFYIDPIKKELKSISSKTKVKLGTRVTVKVDDVNIPLKEVYFELKDIHRTLERVKKADI